MKRTVEKLRGKRMCEKNAPKPIKIVMNKFLPKYYNGIVVKKGNDQLAKAILAALNELNKEDVYKPIMKKWGIKGLAMDEFGINLATKKPLNNKI